MQLRPYQIAGRDFLARNRHALLADEMRVGKTPQAILAAHAKGAQSMLVTCPAIAVPHWEREIEKWWPSGPLPVFAAWSYDKARAKWQDGLRGTVDVFIPDECHFARNPTAARTGMVYGKTGFAYRAGATWALSGTPAPKHAAELWPMMRAFGIVGLDYPAFVQRYCTIDWLSKLPKGTKASMIPELRALLAKFMLRRTRREVAPEMPEIAFDFLEMNIWGREPAWNELDDDAFLHMAEMDTEDRIAVAMAKAEKLVEEVRFVIDNGLLKQTVIFGWHTEPLKYIACALGASDIAARLITGETSSSRREEIQREFREGRCQVVVANILAAGTAIDLAAASHGYFLELDWLGSNNMQAANRLISMDKAAAVTFDVCTAPGTVDERVQAVLVRRTREIRELGLG